MELFRGFFIIRQYSSTSEDSDNDSNQKKLKKFKKTNGGKTDKNILPPAPKIPAVNNDSDSTIIMNNDDAQNRLVSEVCLLLRT